MRVNLTLNLTQCVVAAAAVILSASGAVRPACGGRAVR